MAAQPGLRRKVGLLVGALDQREVAVASGQRQDFFACGSREGQKSHPPGCQRIQFNHLPQRVDRVEGCAAGAAQVIWRKQRRRAARVPGPPQEGPPVGFIRLS